MPKCKMQNAVKSGAEYIVTGDKALKAVGEYQGIKILTAQEFLRTIQVA